MRRWPRKPWCAIVFDLHAPSSPLRPERRLRWRQEPYLRRWRNPPQEELAEANFEGLNWAGANLRVSGGCCGRPRFVAERLRLQERTTAQAPRQRGQCGNGARG